MNPQPRQIRAARALLGWKQATLDHYAGVASNTTHFAEAGREMPEVRLVANALFNAGIRFIEGGVVLERRA